MAETKKAYGQMLVSKNEDGIAVVEFEGLVTSNVPLDTENQDFANAINELSKKLQQGGEGVDTEPLIKMEWDDINNTVIETYESGDIKKYILAVQNKGTSSENVSGLTFPDGHYISIVGWYTNI